MSQQLQMSLQPLVKDKKMLKADLIKVISRYFKKKNQKMNNLSKANMKTLNDIVNKYNINVTEEFQELEHLAGNGNAGHQQSSLEELKQYMETDKEYSKVLEKMNEAYQKMVITKKEIKVDKGIKEEMDNEVTKIKVGDETDNEIILEI